MPLGIGHFATSAFAKVHVLEVYKSPSCGCCGAWVDHMRSAGFQVVVTDITDLRPIKNKFGGELFIDIGRFYETIYEFTTTNLIWDYGMGIIYHTGLGPIRIDVGFPYGELENPQLHASLLYMF